VPPGRALGIGLLAGGLSVLVLMLVWLAVSGAQSGGIVLGLLLALILAGPLIGGGVYVLSRQGVERQAAQAFATKRKVVESDRVFRDEIGAALGGLASRPEMQELRLGELADQLTAAYRRGAAWEDVVQLDDANLDILRRYDDLVRERVRRLRDGAPDVAAVVRELRQAIDQRDDVVRGRMPPTLEPSVLLRSGEPRRGAAALEALRVGDAVSRERDDYVVDAVADYFAEGQRWRLIKLVPTGAETPLQWLYVGPGALEIALLEEAEGSPQSQTDTAVVDVQTRSGKAQGVLVSYVRARDGSDLRLAERWPDGTVHAYSGQIIDADDLDVWPAVNA
jgi:hypothetical protein